MKTVLYIHGFNGNPKGGTFDGLVKYFSTKEDYQVISFPFPKLHTDVEETQKEIERLIEENNVQILIGASLGGFYTLCCKKSVKKIVINPCMIPSVEIPMLKDRITGEPIHIEEKVLNSWRTLEKFDLPLEFKNAAGIFGKQDKTFHYDENNNFSPLFKEKFSDKITLIDGVHSLEDEQIFLGMNNIEVIFR